MVVSDHDHRLRRHHQVLHPLTLGEFRLRTAGLPDSTLFIERAHSEIRVVMRADFEPSGEVGLDEDALAQLEMTPEDLGIPEGTDLDDVKVINFSAWD